MAKDMAKDMAKQTYAVIGGRTLRLLAIRAIAPATGRAVKADPATPDPAT